MLQDWPQALRRYHHHLRLERGLAAHTCEAYHSDVAQSIDYLAAQPPAELRQHLERYVQDELASRSLSDYSLARKLSALRSFFNYLVAEGSITDNPCAWLDSPKLSRHLPTVLSLAQVDAMLATFDTTALQGLRNRAMLELLYSSGLRVSELVGLTLQHYHPTEGYVQVVGKGDKERLVPVGGSALGYISQYLTKKPNSIVKKGSEGIIFLSKLGGRLSRVMVFKIIQAAARAAGIAAPVGPHTLRHCFATHLIEGGADLRAVQEMMGHASITTTEVYLHLDTQYLREVHALHHPRQ